MKWRALLTILLLLSVSVPAYGSCPKQDCTLVLQAHHDGCCVVVTAHNEAAPVVSTRQTWQAPPPLTLASIHPTPPKRPPKALARY